MKAIKLTFIFGLIVMVAWSCSDSTSVNNNWNPTYKPYASAKKIVAPINGTIGLAQDIPGFGGWFINKSNQLAIYLTHPEQQKTKAKAVLSNSEFVKKVLSNTSVSDSNMVFKKGSYTFIELNQWEKQISNKIEIDGDHFIGIDESRNVVSIGVESKSARDKIHNNLAKLKIPEDAVIISKVTMWMGVGH